MPTRTLGPEGGGHHAGVSMRMLGRVGSGLRVPYLESETSDNKDAGP